MALEQFLQNWIFDDGRDFYETLGVEQTISDTELKIVLRKQTLLWHPDKVPTNISRLEQELIDRPNSEERIAELNALKADMLAGEEGRTRMLVKINTIKEVFRDPLKRAPYDRELADYKELFRTLHPEVESQKPNTEEAQEESEELHGSPNPFAKESGATNDDEPLFASAAEESRFLDDDYMRQHALYVEITPELESINGSSVSRFSISSGGNALYYRSKITKGNHTNIVRFKEDGSEARLAKYNADDYRLMVRAYVNLQDITEKPRPLNAPSGKLVEIEKILQEETDRYRIKKGLVSEQEAAENANKMGLGVNDEAPEGEPNTNEENAQQERTSEFRNN